MGRPRKHPPQLMIAIQDGFVEKDGIPYFIKGGKTIKRADHWLVTSHPHLFRKADYIVEQATAAPGEQRG